jgi:hypothetical protein
VVSYATVEGRLMMTVGAGTMMAGHGQQHRCASRTASTGDGPGTGDVKHGDGQQQGLVAKGSGGGAPKPAGA